MEYLAADQPNGTLRPGLTVTPGAAVLALEENTTAGLPLTITADNTVTTAGSLVLRISSDNTEATEPGAPAREWQKINISYLFSDAIPALRWSTLSNTVGVHPGEDAPLNLTLRNIGFMPATQTTLRLLNAADNTAAPGWATLNVNDTVESIPVGQGIPVSLTFAPATGMGQGQHQFRLRATSDNLPPQDTLITVIVSSSGTGHALFHASDIYTGSTNAQGQVVQGLAGAVITLNNILIPSQPAVKVTTDELGEALFQDLPVGNYRYTAQAPGHMSSEGTIWIQPGATTTKEVGLQNQLVSVEWEVVPTTIQDRYDVVLNATFETNVPAPVIIAEPSFTNLPAMQAGDVYNGQIRFTNHGLIEAQGVKFNMPSSDEYMRFELLATVPEIIGPGESITLPYRITCTKTLPFSPGTAARYIAAGAGVLTAGSIGLVLLTLCFTFSTLTLRLRRLGHTTISLGLILGSAVLGAWRIRDKLSGKRYPEKRTAARRRVSPGAAVGGAVSRILSAAGG